MKIISLSGIIGIEATPQDVRTELQAANGEPVRIDIGSPGGFVMPGLEIFNLIREYKGETEARLMGMAASMASYLALAADKITAHDNAVYMIHNVLGISIGDHRELRATANNFEKLTNLLAREYSKKTKKPMDEVRSMMDDETYLFGEEIAEAGFADEIITTDEQTDKEEACAYAQLSVQNCIKTMKEREEANDDMTKAAAYLNIDDEFKNNSKKIEKEDEKEATDMNLHEFLDSNPDAKALYDKNMAEAETKGKEEGSKDAKARIDKCTAFMTKDYPVAIQVLAVKALKGDEEVASLVGAVTIFDAQKEAAASAAAAGETEEGGETAAEGPSAVTEDGAVASEEDLQTEIARAKGGKK